MASVDKPLDLQTEISNRWPLWLQLGLSLLVVLILVNLLTTSLSYHVISDYQFRQFEERSRNSLSLLAASAIDSVITEDIPLLNTIATQSLQQAPNMLSLTIENEAGEILVQRQRSQKTDMRKLRGYSDKVRYEGEQFGTIHILWDTEPVEREIRRYVTNVQLFISVMLILLTGLIVIMIYWLTIRPMRKISRYLTMLSEGRPGLSLDIPISASRELALLSASAIELSDMISQRSRRELKLLHTREELKIAHDEALSANRAKSGFLAAMSHEIRTPMNAILGILGLLRDTPLNGKQKQLVTTGREAGELLLTIINDVLDFSKMEADKLELEHSGFDLHRLLNQSIELLHHQARQKNLELVLQIEPELPKYVSGDPDRLRQILINLVNNAIKFTQSGSITVRASVLCSDHEGLNFCCSVEDTGVGIAQEIQTSLFDEFTMADQSHSRQYKGTGLGLAICKRLVILMQGSICCQSQLGKGSIFTFNIELGLAQEDDCDTEITIIDPGSLPSTNTRILLAEDNPANQMVIKNILEFAGLQVDIVGNGSEAIEAVRNLPYDIVLMDISMPQMDGISATREIRSLPGAMANIPIIALTAHALSGDRECFLEAGMNDYLSKPIDRNATLYCIARWVDGKHDHPSQTLPDNPPVDQISTELSDEYVSESVLQQLVRDTDADVVADLLTLYIADAQERMKLIDGSQANNNIKVLEFESHTLGSSAAAHGNIKLHKLARNIERLCQSNRNRQAFRLVADLVTVAEESFGLLEKRIEKGFKLVNTG